MNYYKTSEIAHLVKVHPNTVRLYEEWGLLQPVPRNDNGYRLYSEQHLDQMYLARTALRCEFVEGDIRRLATEVVVTAAKGDYIKALEKAYSYLEHIRGERKKAIEALHLINEMLCGNLRIEEKEYYKRADVAKLLEVSIDVLRNWERNGLIEISRNKNNGYRVYGEWEIKRLKIIRTLRKANYSIMSIYRMLRQVDFGNINNLYKVIDTPSPDEDIISATDRWITSLKETEEDAKEVIELLKRMIRKYNKKPYNITSGAIRNPY